MKKRIEPLVDTQELLINMGPQHPSTHGVFRVILQLDGETVVGCKPVIGYLHRGVEKLAENLTYPQVLPITDRMDYLAAPAYNQGYVEAVEKMMGIEVPPRAQYIRVMITELTRLASHLVWLGTHALDIGAMTIFFYTFREREVILDMFERYCGARLTTSTFRIGGLLEDLPDGFIKEVQSFINILPARIKDYETILTGNRIWLQRIKNVGVISAEQGINLGLSGPNIRGSGVQWDLRKAEPYSYYDKFDFIVPTGENGDTFDRYLVRLEEMKQSMRIVQQTIDGLPEGDIRATVPKVIKPPEGEIYHRVEAPKGELGFYICSDGSPKPYRFRVRGPSFVNLQSFETLITGHLVADVIAIIGTLDIVLGEVDR
jgi:NADH-quinone oxidoreductase subunit D